MGTKYVLSAFDTYQRERLAFTQKVSEMANRSVNIGYLLQCEALSLLHPLLKDPSQKVQQSAALAVGKLANASQEAAREIIRLHLLPTLLEDIDQRSKYYKKSSMYTIKSISKYSGEMALNGVNLGSLEGVLLCLEDFEGGVKEAALLALGTIARHNSNLAHSCIQTGAIPMVKLCLQEPEVCMKQIAAATLGDIAKHNTTLAQAITDAGCVPHLVRALNHPSAGLKRQILCTLGHLSKHSITLAEIVVETELIPDVLLHLGHPDLSVRKNAANLIAEITKHHLQLARIVVNSGGIRALLEMIRETTAGEITFPAVLALGYISSQSEALALSIINEKGIEVLAELFEKENEDYILSIIAWTIGQIGKHSPQHVEMMSKSNIFSKLLELYSSPTSSQDLSKKCRVTLKQTVRKCLNMQALNAILETAPPEILKYVLGQFCQILPKDPKARRSFVMTGTLKRVQRIQADPGSSTMEYLNIINHCFPEEIIRYFTPGYSDELVKIAEEYTPTIPPIFAHEHDEVDDPDLIGAFNTPLKPEIC